MVDYWVGGNGLIHTYRQRTQVILYYMDIRYHISSSRYIMVKLKDFWFWYKYNAPKYGYVMSIQYSLFNCMYFKRDGSFRTTTRR